MRVVWGSAPLSFVLIRKIKMYIRKDVKRRAILNRIYSTMVKKDMNLVQAIHFLKKQNLQWKM